MEVINNNNHWKLMILILKEIADDQKRTHEWIAKETGLHRSNVSRFFSLKYCPTLQTFLLISRSLKTNIFIESKDSKSELNVYFEKAMESLGRVPSKLPKN